ncbi:MAG TPA: N-acetyl-gamma-glutamyl-phosphate reductase [Bacteroidota bacterium]|nr:N-acetyl-gamma-glutamyl-phosphate reductase [Bacteroidota bacterium]
MKEPGTNVVNAAIIGASGYSGAELLRILSTHPEVRIRRVTAASSAGQRVDALYPALAGQCDLEYEELLPEKLSDIDVAFLALPSGQAMNIVPELKAKVPRIIDLGGDFRLKSPALYEQYYKHPHTAASLLESAVYGLPEMNRKAVASATLVANPGCYATSVILALLPALEHGIARGQGIVINSLSGVSGAGRSASVEMSFAEINENVRAYKLLTHQHIPEIESVLGGAFGGALSVSFVPHLVPLTRGIYTTVHAQLATNVRASEVVTLYQQYYATHPFVRITNSIPQILSVRGTNYCDIALYVDQRTNQLIIISVIDNLVKGAAGQAIQNMNLMFALDETTGLR